MKFIKKFETHDPDYLNYMNSENKILPNLSYCEDVGDVHLNPWVETRVVAKFNVTSTSSATNIMYSFSRSQFSEIEIDGVVQPGVVSSYTFDTTGEHVVKYTLVEPTTIGDSAFYYCTELTSVTIPNSITIISQSAFNACTGFTSITIPDSVTSIGNNAFKGCTGLTNITIPNSVTTIGNNAFGGCSSLTIIKVDSGNTVYDSRNNCNAIIETASNTLLRGGSNTSIPNSVTTIGNSAFGGCTGLTSITIPNNVTSIGDYAFDQTGLTSVTIPNGVTTIGNIAFRSCSSLTSVTIGNSVSSIGDNAFYNCTSLTSITSLTTTAPTIQTQTFRGVKNGGTLTVPTGSTGYDVWMGTGNYYLGQYSWTKVEQ